jgi:hypothetical protein
MTRYVGEGWYEALSVEGAVVYCGCWVCEGWSLRTMTPHMCDFRVLEFQCSSAGMGVCEVSRVESYGLTQSLYQYIF